MRSVATTLWAVFGLASTVYATDALATLSPCPDCPKSIAPAPITITSQLQPVSTCTPQKTCSKKHCHLEPSCSTYDWISSTVPCLGGASSTLITKTDQIVELSHVSTVLTSYSPCATTAPSWNGTIPKYQNQSCTSTTYQTMIVDLSAPFDECGPMALGSWAGSGLCKKCAPNADTTSQVVTVSKCLDGVCSTYPETWVSAKPTATASSESKASFSSSYSCSKGVNTIPITATYSPSGDSAYTAPVTSSFAVTTSVPSPQVVDVTTSITVTFSAYESQSQETSSSMCPTPIATSTFCSSNGVHTIPITKTFTPTGSVYTEPVTTTVYYTTSVTDAPKTIECTTTVTVTFTTTYCPAKTVVSGSTLKPTAPATTNAGSTTNGGASATPTVSTGTKQPFSHSHGSGPTATSQSAGGSTGGPSATHTGTSRPTSPPIVGSCDFLGCFGSKDGFAGFSLVETSAKLTIEICTSECLAAGYPYAGLHEAECYCAAALDENCGTDKANGVCDKVCPGNSLELCGGNGYNSKKLKRSSPMLLDVYECPLPTTTSSSSTETGSATVSSTPNPSSDPDAEPEKRDIQADMELSVKKSRDIKLRRGGMLRSLVKTEAGPALKKRDLGLKQLFGL